MTREYALSRVKDALENCNGKQAEAERTILNWLKNDQTLMVGLVAPHLKSIVSHAVDYVAHKEEMAKKPTDEDTSDDPLHDATGQSILENLLQQGKSGGPRFGDFDEPYSKPGKASASHVDAIHKIARKVDKEDK